MKEYSDPAALKSAARVHLFGNYGVTVRAYIWMNAILLILSWLFASMNIKGAGSLISVYIFYIVRILLAGVFMSGMAYIFLNIASSRPVYPGMIFYGFRQSTDRAVLVCIVISLGETIGCIPLIIFLKRYLADRNSVYIIPLVLSVLIAIAGYLVVHAYFMPAYYVIHDFPDYSFVEVIKLCPRIMQGSILRAIYLNLSFIPMMLLSIISLGAGAPWTESYRYASFCEMYLDIMKKGK
ncbi:MAG: DUF975 family protein [Lachnospiraceae bacterium]|nr:DUF975 family protein [Lachnospiraceae bacterium]